ncbi:hypothetical protein KT99_04469 [Shewanella benthica KT99]|uniref:Uncharacterized protein n=1 Tax=Shewanella benthica KT99 TaxID=314608 RepID=A9D2L3_9GAMM|nr:hypothetical protein KT99_04469 [Shewanella benthica KT99]
MKLSKVAGAIMALTVSVSTSVIADDDRYIIQVDSSKKGVIKALTK